MRVRVGRIDELPTDRCVAVAGGRAVVVRLGDTPLAFENRCLHQASPLAGGRVDGGVLICPLHFWRYRLPTGRVVGSERTLTAYPVTVEGGEVVVEIPDDPGDRPIRDVLLDHARTWSREEGT